MLQYFYGQQAEQFSFYRVPKLLFTDRKFSKISMEAKFLYGILLDRMNLSAKNGWFDEKGRVYIIFPVNEVMEALDCGKQKAARLLEELETKGDLIERVRQGLGKPNLIYVKNFFTPESNFLKFENHTSGGSKIEPAEVPKSAPNNINQNNTENSNTNLSFHSVENENEPESEASLQSEYSYNSNSEDEPVYEENRKHSEYRSYFWDWLEFDQLIEKYDMQEDLLYEILEIMVDVVCCKRKTIRVSGDDKPIDVVRSQFMKITREHIEFIMHCMKENTSKIKNMKQYLLATIYNAPLTMGNYYSSLAQYHMSTGQF